MTDNTTLLVMSLAREVYASLITIIFYAWFARLRYNWPMRVRRILICTGINFLVHAYTRFFVPREVVSYLITAVDLIVVTRILWYPHRGFAYWTAFFFAFCCATVQELCVALLYTALSPHPEVILQFMGRDLYMLDPRTIPALFLATAVAMLVPPFVVQCFKKPLKSEHKRQRGWVYFVRFGLILVLLFTVLVIYGQRMDMLLYTEVGSDTPLRLMLLNLPEILVYMLGVVLLLFYGFQDIQQYKLHLRNQTLLDKNIAYQRVIDSTREFRHNIANMIYGLEGIILTRDMEKIERYYAEMSHRCALINNENAVALNRLTDASLTALILRKLDIAEEKQILFYLNVDSGFTFDSLPSHRLCEAMGNLMDNALEAAQQSTSPQINLMLRSTPEYDEILLDNTYSEASDLSFLSGDAKSSKEGHQAIGISSVRKILAKYPNACFNMYVQGRYIEASLCEYKR